MMAATLELTGALKSYTGGKPSITIETGRKVRDILVSQGIPPEIIALVTVNGLQQDKDYWVQDGDLVKVLAVMGGG